MKNLIKVFLFVLVLSVAMSLVVGCGGGATEESSAPIVVPTEGQTSPEEIIEVGEAKFELLDYNVFLDQHGNLKIVGMIENFGDAASHPDSDAFQLVDASGNIIAEPYPETFELIAPGQKSPVTAEIYESEGIPENWQDLEVRLLQAGYPADLIFDEYIPLEAKNLASKTFDAQSQGEPGIFGVSGWIDNVTESPTEHPIIMVAGYDAWGKLIDVVSDYPDPDYLDPGMSAPFIALLSMVEPIVSFEVFAQGEVVEPRSLAEIEVADYSIVSPEGDGTMFLGEVVNNGSTLAVETEIVIVLVNELGQVADIAVHSSSAISLAPGDKLPFKFSSYAPQEMWAEPLFILQGFTEESLSERYTGIYTDLELVGLDTLGEKYGRYSLTGQITNTGESEANVDLGAALYDAQGKVMDVEWSYGLYALKPGTSETLELIFSVEVEEEVASFEIFYGALSEAY